MDERRDIASNQPSDLTRYAGAIEQIAELIAGQIAAALDTLAGELVAIRQIGEQINTRAREVEERTARNVQGRADVLVGIALRADHRFECADALYAAGGSDSIERELLREQANRLEGEAIEAWAALRRFYREHPEITLPSEAEWAIDGTGAERGAR
jgi:hypothetical protein